MPDGDVLDILSLSQPSISSPSGPSDEGVFSPKSEPAWRTKDIVLIRHGRSSWNEFLGAHKRAQWEEQEQKRQAAAKGSGGVRNVLRSMVGRGEGHASAYPAQPKTQTDLLDLGEAYSAGRHQRAMVSADTENAEGPVLLGQRIPQHDLEDEKDLNVSAKGDPACQQIPVQGRACSTPCLGWFQMLYATFGSFVPLGMLVYGLQESFAKSSGDFACKYYMMDVLKLDGATMGRLQTAAHVPWDIKPVLGMCSDALPLWGFHRTSYLVCACVFSICLYLWVGFNAVSALGLFAYLTGLNLAIAFADLVIDATAASLAKDHPKAASDMQTALRVAEASGGMAASSIKGYLVAVLGSRGTMMSNVVCAVAVFIPAIRRWLPEEQLLGGRCTPKLSQFRKNSSITAVAIFLSVVAVGLSLSHIFLQEWRTRALVTLFCCIVVTISAYKAMRKISPFLANTGMLLFWRAVLQPGLGEAMFVWMSKDEEGPRFSPQLMGLADCFGQAGFLLGVVVYNRFLRTWKYRRIFLVGQIMVVASQVLDFILVMRWNQALGIPDVLFFLGDSTFDHAVAKTFYVPLVVLAYKVCPSNLEGTIFSTLISLNNIGVDCGKYLGITLCEVWGIVDGNFDHLPHGVVSKALVRLLPIPLILMLSPDLTPDDPIPQDPHTHSQQN